MAPAQQLRESLLGARANRPPPPPPSCIPWQAVFYINVFMACISFSIVMPSLFLYLQGMGSNPGFYALVVACYSVGEAIGSVLLGALSNLIGTKRTMQVCATISCCGALSYALADVVPKPSAAVLARAASTSGLTPPSLGPIIVLAGRMLQGIGSGGQQAVEQAYFTVAVPYEERTAMTAKLSTFACLGFIFGPALGAIVTQTPDFVLGAVRFDAFTKQGWLCALLNLSMFTMGTLFFNEVRLKPQDAMGAVEADEEGSQPEPHRWSVWALILFFFVHFNGFAVQETITTPLVRDWFSWDETAANLLFTAAGVGNFICAILMSYLSSSRPDGHGGLTQLVEDRVLLVTSMALALLGWLLMVPPDDWLSLPAKAINQSHGMGLAQFGVGFGAVSLAFPFGRGICLAMVGKLLGDQPQGAWMGIMFALGAIARIAGPFWAVTGYYNYGSLSVFGSTALLFLASLVATRALWHRLVPPPLPPVGVPGAPKPGDRYSSPKSQSRRGSIHSPRIGASPLFHPCRHPGYLDPEMSSPSSSPRPQRPSPLRMATEGPGGAASASSFVLPTSVKS